MNFELNLETKTDDELIELWTQVTRTMNAMETSDASKRQPQIVMQIYNELTKRGYASVDGQWVKDEEDRA